MIADSMENSRYSYQKIYRTGTKLVHACFWRLSYCWRSKRISSPIEYSTACFGRTFACRWIVSVIHISHEGVLLRVHPSMLYKESTAHVDSCLNPFQNVEPSKKSLFSFSVELCRSPVDDVFVTICPTKKSSKFNPNLALFVYICSVFHGVIFVRKGLFGGGIFRFNVSIPDDFPNTMALPTVIFEKDIFHPSIEMKTRIFDLNKSFPDGWKPNRHSLRRVIIVVQVESKLQV